MTRSEKILYHQIHPLKLGTDATAGVVSLYFFWQHRLWLALALHFLPPIVASALVISLSNLEQQRNSAFGRYVKGMMTTTIEALRLSGDIVMVFGAWYHSYTVIASGLVVIVAAWLSSLVLKDNSGTHAIDGDSAIRETAPMTQAHHTLAATDGVLITFVRTERDRFSGQHNNMFAFAFSKITRYSQFVDVILERCNAASARFLENTNAMRATMQEGNHPLTLEQLELFGQGLQLTAVLHLEVESFYLFTKILLDNIARAVEFYFGQARGRPLDSHDDLVKNLPGYAAAKGLTNLPDRLVALAAELKQDVSDYRDYEIAHEKSPRTMKATAFNLDGTGVRIASTKLYPGERDQQKESRPPDEVMLVIAEYLAAVVACITENRDRTALELVHQPRPHQHRLRLYS
jgi:hypothetical protein